MILAIEMKKNIFLFFLLTSSLLFAQAGRYDVANLAINTKDNEFNTTITSGGYMLYAKSKNNGSANNNEISSVLHKGKITSKGKFNRGSKFVENAAHVAFTKDGKYVYYSKEESGKFQLFRAVISKSGRWKFGEKLPFCLPDYNFKQPALNADGSLLFFVSDMPSSYGATDIYYVSIEKKETITYGVAVNLGVSVNSVGIEVYPFIDANDKLFFSSTDASMGGLDVYESSSVDGLYSDKVALDSPINSTADDFALIISASAESGYFSSNRSSGKGGVDIYFFKEKELPEGACSGYIRGDIKDKASLKPVIEATVECFDHNGNAQTVLTNTQGRFVFNSIKCEMRYDIVSYKEGFSFAEVQTVATKGTDLTLYLEADNQEEFEEEINLADETTIIDTETNQVIQTYEPEEEENSVADNIEVKTVVVPERKLPFAEKRELDRLRKVKEKKNV